MNADGHFDKAADEKTTFVMLTMAFKSGMGHVASELGTAATRLGHQTVLIAPPMEYEPEIIRRIKFARPTESKSRARKLIGLAVLTFHSAYLTWRECRPGYTLLMIDLYPTVPLSIFPALLARVRRAKSVLNLHDFYPHAFRYPVGLRWLERAFYRIAYRQFDNIACMKDAQVARLVSEAGIHPDRILVVRHGPIFVPGINFPTNGTGDMRLLVMGSLRSNKAILECISAIQLCRRSGMRVILRVAGAPRREESHYWAACRRALDAIPDAEVIDRFIPEEELADILSDVDGIICAYRDFDSQSGVSVLAAANGIPLIATASSVPDELMPIPETWTEIETPTSPTSIARALAQFAETPRQERFQKAAKAAKPFRSAPQWSAAIQAVLSAQRDTSL